MKNYTNIKAYEYYYSKLNKIQQEIYRETLDYMDQGIQNFTMRGLEHEKFYDVSDAIYYDHPEYYWVPTGYNFDYCDKTITVHMKDIYSKSERKRIDEKIAKLVSVFLNKVSKEKTAKDKVRYACEFLCKHTEYEINNQTNQNMASCLAFGKAQCSGYSQALKFLLDLIEIPCISVTGTGGTGSKKEPHQWSMVQIDNVFYHVDVTWIDSNTGDNDSFVYVYLLDSDEMMKEHHCWDKKFFPKCPLDIEFRSVNQDGFYSEKFTDVKNMAYKIQNAIDVNNRSVSFEMDPRWDSKKAFDVADSALKYVKSKRHISLNYTYLENILNISFIYK